MKKIVIILFLLVSAVYSFGQQIENDSLVKPNDDELLASQFYQDKEFDKAAALYGKLYNKNPNPFYYNNYLNCLLELKDYSEAEKVIKKRIKKESSSLKYRVDLGYIYLRANQMSKSEKEFESILKDFKGDYQETVDVANAFLVRNLTDYAVKSYLRGRSILKDKNIFNFELANIYERTGRYQEMTDEYLNLTEENRSILEQVENSLQIVLSNDGDSKKNETLKKSLIKRIQQNPNNISYAEMLLWLAVQNKDFESALQQAKTLDRLYKEEGSRIYKLAQLCTSNKEYSLAEDAYSYILKKGKNNPYYVNSSIEVINVRYQRIIHSFNYKQQEIKDLESSYTDALKEFGKSSITVSLIKNLAHLQAFYLDKYKEAGDLLNDAIKLQQLTQSERAECKTELADILLMSGDVWEATLLYSQVEKDFKHDTIGYTAKFKNAKLFYYIGEFRWAKAQLDILKAATSKLIANDAMELFLLINDNTDETDSTGAADLPVRMYARADLYTFQNKNELALQTLDSVLQLYSGHQICDRTFYKEAEIKLKQGKYEEADTLFGTVVSKFTSSVMVDDAIFKMAELNQFQYKNKDKAMNLYEKLLKDFPASIYAVDARKRFRQLRGDLIN
jgi:tetratricopeptide (TPR) repeat protein